MKQGSGPSGAEKDEMDVVVRSMRISEELDSKVNETARAVGLRKSDVMRLALDRGLDRLIEQLGKTA